MQKLSAIPPKVDVINIIAEHAVSTSVVYLTRSTGSVWGVALTSTIIQNSVASLLPRALRHVDGYEQVSAVELLNKTRFHLISLPRLSKISFIRYPRYRLSIQRSAHLYKACTTRQFTEHSPWSQSLRLWALLRVSSSGPANHQRHESRPKACAHLERGSFGGRQYPCGFDMRLS